MPLHQIRNLTKTGIIRERIIHSKTSAFGINPEKLGNFIGVNLFKYEYKGTIKPGLVTLKGVKYLTPGWKEVHPKTELNDIIWTKPKIKSSNEKFEFKSNSSGKIYTTKRITRGKKVTYSCNCPGNWRAPGNCTHIKQVKIDKN